MFYTFGEPQQMISGFYDASIRIWSIQEKTQVEIFKGQNKVVYAVLYLKGPSLVIFSDCGSKVIVLDFITRKKLGRIICYDQLSASRNDKKIDYANSKTVSL